MAAWGYEFYFLVLKVSLQRSKIKFVSPRSHEYPLFPCVVIAFLKARNLCITP